MVLFRTTEDELCSARKFAAARMDATNHLFWLIPAWYAVPLRL